MITNVVSTRIPEVPRGDSRLSVRSSASELPLSHLARVCAEETSKYRRGEPVDGECCYELFRRAVCHQDQHAWQTLVEQYRGVVVFWVRRHPSARDLGEDDDFWVDGAFARFYQAISPERFNQFSAVPQILSYLKLCVHSVIQDALRSLSKQPRTVPIEGTGQSGGDDDVSPLDTLSSRDGVDHSSNARELWQTVEKVLQSDVERRVAYLSLVLEYKPREIQALYPTMFPAVGAIYPVLRNVVDRLQRNVKIREFLQ